ncbi:MAG: VWA domain-containing protein [Leucobacter sp.]
MIQGDGSRDAAPPQQQGATAAGETDEQAKVIAGIEEEAVVDPKVRAAALEIASRLSIPKPRRDSSATRGLGELLTVPYRGASDEIDLDATIGVLAEHPLPEDEDILVRERLRTRRSIVLLVDVSGSMKGERIATAAATVGALAGELSNDALAVVAFWSDAAVVLPLGDPVKPMDLLDRILRIPARGLTNVAFPLEVAAEQLARVPAREARVILLSDCVHNAGPDPRPFAAKLPRLDVLLDASGEKDVDLGRELASRGRGTCHVIHDYRQVAPALSEILRR